MAVGLSLSSTNVQLNKQLHQLTRDPLQLVLEITQGIGLALAVGIRPYLPLLLVGALSRSELLIDLQGTQFVFLQTPGFLLAVIVLLIVVTLLMRSIGPAKLDQGVVGLALLLVSVTAGALLFSASLDAGGYSYWVGLPAGAVCSLLALASTRDLQSRVRERLDSGAQSALVVYADAAALLVALIALLLPPLSLLVSGLLIWLLIGGKQQRERKYAGLRSLR